MDTTRVRKSCSQNNNLILMRRSKKMQSMLSLEDPRYQRSFCSYRIHCLCTRPIRYNVPAPASHHAQIERFAFYEHPILLHRRIFGTNMRRLSPLG